MCKLRGKGARDVRFCAPPKRIQNVGGDVNLVGLEWQICFLHLGKDRSPKKRFECAKFGKLGKTVVLKVLPYEDKKSKVITTILRKHCHRPLFQSSFVSKNNKYHVLRLACVIFSKKGRTPWFKASFQSALPKRNT